LRGNLGTLVAVADYSSDFKIRVGVGKNIEDLAADVAGRASAKQFSRGSFLFVHRLPT
jgi:hypothetical protein